MRERKKREEKRRGEREKAAREEKSKHTLLAILPLILPIITILPLFSYLTICLATAWHVIKHPVTLTLIISSQSAAVYSSAGVSCWIPAAAISPSILPCASAISPTMLFICCTSRTSMRL